MALSEARRRANYKYDREHMTIIACRVRREVADEFKAACAANGTTPNAVLLATVRQYIADHGAAPGGSGEPGSGAGSPTK